MNKIVEICCGSFEDAVNAYNGGAKRIELNSALHLGGLTPTAATLTLIKQQTALEVICMVRPRGAGFCYTKLEQEQMFNEAENLLKTGADGLAFGFLRNNYTVDEQLTARMVNLVHKYKKTAVFHRAFDCVNDYKVAIKTLIDLKVDRILTSGLQAKAITGKEVLKYLQTEFGDKIELLAGSGIKAQNAKSLMEYTGISQVHSSCKNWRKDVTTVNNKVSYAFAEGNFIDCYDYVDENLVKELINAI